MSHYLRCLTLADQLKLHYDVRFATSPAYAKFIVGAGYATFPFTDFDLIEILRQSQEFRFDWLEENALEQQFEQQKAIIHKHRPVAVIGDNSFSLKMAAEACDVKFIALMNAYMTQYYEPGRKLTRTHPKARLMERLPTSLYWYIIRKIEKYHFNHIHTPFKKIRAKQGLKPIENYAKELEGDITLLCDLPSLFPQKNLPKCYHFIGPLLFSPSAKCDMPNWDIPKNQKKTILVSMGSSGDYAQIEWLNDKTFSAYNIIVTGDKKGILKGDHILHYNFIPLHEVMPQVNLLICHGGNGTIYEAIRAGVPVLCSPSIFEQEWNEYAIIKNQLGDTLSDVNSPIELLRKINLWENKKQDASFQKVIEKIQTFKLETPLNKLLTDTVFQ